MANYTLSNVLTEKDLIEFDLFTVKDDTKANTLVDVSKLEASSDVINFILRTSLWKGYSTTIDNVSYIGYGTTKNTSGNGLTEQESYNDFIEVLKEKERNLKRILPLSTITQSQYDGLLSLFYFTGSFKEVGSEFRKFKIFDYIEKREWNWVASALVRSGNNRPIRQGEAKIIMLADYGRQTDRTLIKEQGLQDIRTMYPDRLETDLARRQAEFVYFRETNRFLPKTSESRKRQIVKLLT
jgi:GH24 family phage-related lysozyme (muramidase)